MYVSNTITTILPILDGTCESYVLVDFLSLLVYEFIFIFSSLVLQMTTMLMPYHQRRLPFKLLESWRKVAHKN